MAKKSKTQRAKASARRAEKREAVVADVLQEEVEEGLEGSVEASPSNKVMVKEKAETSGVPEKKVKQPGRIRQFLMDVRSEMRRVTWPTREDVIRWSGVVVGALIFFGVFVFVLDNIFPQLLIAIDSLNPTGA